MRLLAWLLVASSFGYVCLVAVLYVMQRELLFQPPQKFRTAPTDANFPQAEEVVLKTQDDEKIIAWHVPPRGDRPIIVFFHGNGDSLPTRVSRFQNIISNGTGLLAVSFRGYAGSSGSPSEKGLLLDAEAAYVFATTQYSSERIAIWGYSLGSGPAVMTAAKRKIGKLILEAPYTSAVDVAASIYPYVPVRLLMKDSFLSIGEIKNIAAPLLVLHGEHDQTIAIALGRRLFDMAPEPKRFVAFPLGSHTNLDQFGVVSIVHQFLVGANAGPAQ